MSLFFNITWLDTFWAVLAHWYLLLIHQLNGKNTQTVHWETKIFIAISSLFLETKCINFLQCFNHCFRYFLEIVNKTNKILVLRKRSQKKIK